MEKSVKKALGYLSYIGGASILFYIILRTTEGAVIGAVIGLVLSLIKW